jgi:hypothetical protein
LRDEAPDSELEAAVSRLDGQAGSEDAVFLLVRKLAKKSPKYQLRYAEFFDPLDKRSSGSVKKNAKNAYDEYELARKAGLKVARERQENLLEWAEDNFKKGDEGAIQLVDAFNSDLDQ